MSFKVLKKVGSIFILVTFLATNVAYASPGSKSLFKNKKVDYDKISNQSQDNLQKRQSVINGENAKEVQSQQKEAKKVLSSHLEDISQIHIPQELGKVIEVYQGSVSKAEGATPLIVGIQDLHTNPEAELNLAKILELLLKDYNMGLVCSEGADGKVDTSPVSSFPDYGIRERVARIFINSGELTGEEYLSITKYPDLPIWGIETRDIYFNNIIGFNRIMKFNASSQVFISQTKKAIAELKPRVYSKDLLDLDQKEAEFNSQKLDTAKYIQYLASFTKKLNISISDYKNISLLIETMEKEKTVDQLKIMKDSQNLLLNLQSTLQSRSLNNDLDSLMARSTLFKDQKISPFSFYSYLKDLSLKHLKEEFAAKYPSLDSFVDYLTKVNSLDSTKLFIEFEDLNFEIKEFLSKTDEQKTLVKLDHNISFLESFFNLKVSNEDMDYYLNNKESHKVAFFKDFLPKTLKRYNIDTFIDYNPALIDSHLQELEDFYKVVKDRDIAMVTNSLSEITKRNVKLASLVHGGFHTKGITKLLREKGYSYIIISPYSKTDINEENYHFLLSGRRKPIEELLKKEFDLPKIVNKFTKTLRVGLMFAGNDIQDALSALLIKELGIPKENTTTLATIMHRVHASLATAIAEKGSTADLISIESYPSETDSVTLAFTFTGKEEGQRLVFRFTATDINELDATQFAVGAGNMVAIKAVRSSGTNDDLTLEAARSSSTWGGLTLRTTVPSVGTSDGPLWNRIAQVKELIKEGAINSPAFHIAMVELQDWLALAKEFVEYPNGYAAAVTKRKGEAALNIATNYDNDLRQGIPEAEKLISENKNLLFAVSTNHLGLENLTLVGGKGANLGELIKAGIPPPPAFVLTTNAYNAFLDYNDALRSSRGQLTMRQQIRKEIDALLVFDKTSADYRNELPETGKRIRALIASGEMPEQVTEVIKAVYSALRAWALAVRSTGTAEDLGAASFAGQHDTYLNVIGIDAILDAVKRDWASLYTNRVIDYRLNEGFDQTENVAMAVVLQKMVKSDVSGVMFGVNTMTGNLHEITITTNFGLGETVVADLATPDIWSFSRDVVGSDGLPAFLGRRMGAKEREMVYKPGGGTELRNIEPERSAQWTLTIKQAQQLAAMQKKIEAYYGKPMDTEFAVEDGKIIFVQARPEVTVSVRQKRGYVEMKYLVVNKVIQNTAEVLLSGGVTGRGSAYGRVVVITSNDQEEQARQLENIKDGDIVVVEMTAPWMEPWMRAMANTGGAFLAEKGGPNSHGAIVSRGMKLPAIVGMGHIREKLLRQIEQLRKEQGNPEADLYVAVDANIAKVFNLTAMAQTLPADASIAGETAKMDVVQKIKDQYPLAIAGEDIDTTALPALKFLKGIGVILAGAREARDLAELNVWPNSGGSRLTREEFQHSSEDMQTYGPVLIAYDNYRLFALLDAFDKGKLKTEEQLKELEYFLRLPLYDVKAVTVGIGRGGSELSIETRDGEVFTSGMHFYKSGRVPYVNSHKASGPNLVEGRLDPSKHQKLINDIENKIKGYGSGQEWYLAMIYSDTAVVSNSMYPRTNESRAMDFKLNELKGFLGWSLFETLEANTLMGKRGAYQLLSPRYYPIFRLDMIAKKAAIDAGFDNTHVFFPMVRYPAELHKMLEIANKEGLIKPGGKTNCGFMVELGPNVIAINAFLDILLEYLSPEQFILSFGTNDLTMVTYLKDRELAALGKYESRHSALARQLVHVIKQAHKRNPRIEVSICGNAPSNDPKVLELLVRAGINQLGVFPDVFLQCVRRAADVEEAMEQGKLLPIEDDLFFPEDPGKPEQMPYKKVVHLRELFGVKGLIRVHPAALLDYDNNSLPADLIGEVKAELERAGFTTGHDYYVKQVTGAIRGADIVGTADPYEDTLRGLIGGMQYESDVSENPRVGKFGAAIYLYDGKFREVLNWDLEAFKLVRAEAQAKGEDVKLLLNSIRSVGEPNDDLRAEYGDFPELDTFLEVLFSDPKLRSVTWGLSVISHGNVVDIDKFIGNRIAKPHFIWIDERLPGYILFVDPEQAETASVVLDPANASAQRVVQLAINRVTAIAEKEGVLIAVPADKLAEASPVLLRRGASFSNPINTRQGL